MPPTARWNSRSGGQLLPLWRMPYLVPWIWPVHRSKAVRSWATGISDQKKLFSLFCFLCQHLDVKQCFYFFKKLCRYGVSANSTVILTATYSLDRFFSKQKKGVISCFKSILNTILVLHSASPRAYPKLSKKFNVFDCLTLSCMRLLYNNKL